ncbi:MAG: sulfotransferase [Pseudoruegeria sp.]
MKYKHILIVTFGRTGSTLLMGMLNAVPGVVLRGENYNVCLGLYQAYKSLVAVQREQETYGFQHGAKPFYGAEAIHLETFLADARQMLAHQLIPGDAADTQCWGFKEIRYTNKDFPQPGDLEAYLTFLGLLLPDTAFLFLGRAHEEAVRSAFWKDAEKTTAMQRMAQFDRRTAGWAADRSDCYRLDYADIVSQNACFQQMFAFLGAEYDAEAMSQVAGREHSYGGKIENLPVPEVILRKRKTATLFVTDLKVETEASSAGTLSLGGIVFSREERTVAPRLHVTGSRGTPQITAGIASPWLAEKFPDHPLSGQSRVQISGLSFEPNKPIQIQVAVPGQAPEVIYEVFLKPNT